MGVFNDDNASARPTILVNVANDDPTRGDVAGWRGLARAIAKKTGAQVLYSDVSKFVTAFEYTAPALEYTAPAPQEVKSSAFNLGNFLNGAKIHIEESVDLQGAITTYYGQIQDYDAALAQNLERYAPPTIVLGKGCNTALRNIGQSPEDVYFVTDYNESLSSHLLNEGELVSHHLTPEIIAEAGEKFDEQHPDIKKPIIAVMLVDPYGEETQNDFVKRITKMVKHYPESTIYLCSSRRTEKVNYDQIMDKLQKSMADAGLNNEDRKRVDVVGYAFNREATYNPYQGLIARAKHFIIWGNSQSMMSEDLYSGKTVYVYNYGYATNLAKKGYVCQFNELNLNEPPFSREFEPINLTDQIADKLIEKIESEQGQRRKRVISEFAQRFNKDECAILESLRTNFRRADQIDERLKTNRRFVEAAVSVRGFSLQYFPAFQADAAIVIKAMHQNPNSIKFADECLLDNTRFMTEIISTDYPHLLHHASERLKGDYDFMVMAAKYDKDAFNLASPALRENEHFVLQLIESGHINGKDIPARFLESPETALKIARYAPNVVIASDIFAKTPEMAMQMLQIDPQYYANFPEAVRNNDAVTDMAVSLRIANYIHAPESQKDRMSLTMSVLEKQPALLSDAPESYRDNDGLVWTLVEKAPHCLKSASKRLRSNVDLVAYAMQNDVRCFKYAEAEAAMNADLALAYVRDDPRNIRNIDVNFMYEKDFALAAITQAQSAEAALDVYRALGVMGDRDICTAIVARDVAHIAELPHDVLSDPAFYAASIALRHDVQLEDLKLGRNIPKAYAEAMIQAKPEWADLPAIQNALNPSKGSTHTNRANDKYFTDESFLGGAFSGFKKSLTSLFSMAAKNTPAHYYTEPSPHYHKELLPPLHIELSSPKIEPIQDSFNHDIHKTPDPVIIREGELYVWVTNAPSKKAKPDGKGGVIYETLTPPVTYQDALLDQPKGEFSHLVGIYTALKDDAKGLTMEKDGQSYALLASYHKDAITEHGGKIIVGMKQHDHHSFGGVIKFYERPVVFEGSILGPADVANPHWVGLYVPVDPDTQKPMQNASYASKADMVGAKKKMAIAIAMPSKKNDENDQGDAAIIAAVLKKIPPSGQGNAM